MPNSEEQWEGAEKLYGLSLQVKVSQFLLVQWNRAY
jgi:hypothetical protein